MNLIFETSTRKLESESGYIKSLIDGTIYDHAIYLGIYDSPDNYVVSYKNDYEEYLKKEEEQYELEDYE